MKYRLLELLRCPNCHDILRLFSFAEFEEENSPTRLRARQIRCKNFCGLHQIFLQKNGTAEEKPPIDCTACHRREIAEGLLACKCGALFPILDGVPRFIDDTLAAFPDFKKKYAEKIAEIVQAHDKTGKNAQPIVPEEFKSIHDSFSKEWDFFSYEGDKTWGWNLDERKKVFLEDFGANPNWLKGKLLLDAGCGNGILTATLQDFALEVVGLDLSDSVVRANHNKHKYAKDKGRFVHFVQGNLFTPPFAKGAFDLIYSSGVLHHTPNTKDTFRKLIPLLAKRARIYIWVYRKRGSLVRGFVEHGRLLRRHVSLKSLFVYCRLLSPVYKFITDSLSALKIYQFRKRTAREIALDLFDAFSPQYNHTHTPSEVFKWFIDEQLANVRVSGVQKQGFGVRGDRI
jgi:SAM-dependent methyltransferase